MLLLFLLVSEKVGEGAVCDETQKNKLQQTFGTCFYFGGEGETNVSESQSQRANHTQQTTTTTNNTTVVSW